MHPSSTNVSSASLTQDTSSHVSRPNLPSDLRHSNDFLLGQGSEHPAVRPPLWRVVVNAMGLGCCFDSFQNKYAPIPSNQSSRRSSVDSMTSGPYIQLTPFHIDDRSGPVPMTHPATTIQPNTPEMRVLRNDVLLKNIVSHLNARQAHNLFGSHRLPGSGMEYALGSLSLSEQKAFFANSKPFAKWMREQMSDRHKKYEQRQVTTLSAAASSAIAVKSAWLSARVPLTTEDGSPSRDNFVCYAFDWLDKVMPADISGNPKMAENVRLTIEHLTTTLHDDDIRSNSAFSSHRHVLMGHIKKYFSNSPKLDSAPMIRYYGVETEKLDPGQRRNNFRELVFSTKPITLAAKHSLLYIHSFALSCRGIPDAMTQKAMLTQIADVYRKNPLDGFANVPVLQMLTNALGGPDRGVHVENLSHALDVVGMLLDGEKTLHIEHGGAILENFRSIIQPHDSDEVKTKVENLFSAFSSEVTQTYASALARGELRGARTQALGLAQLQGIIADGRINASTKVYLLNCLALTLGDGKWQIIDQENANSFFQLLDSAVAGQTTMSADVRGSIVYKLLYGMDRNKSTHLNGLLLIHAEQLWAAEMAGTDAIADVLSILLVNQVARGSDQQTTVVDMLERLVDLPLGDEGVQAVSENLEVIEQNERIRPYLAEGISDRLAVVADRLENGARVAT